MKKQNLSKGSLFKNDHFYEREALLYYLGNKKVLASGKLMDNRLANGYFDATQFLKYFDIEVIVQKVFKGDVKTWYDVYYNDFKKQINEN